jgi:hypothetical protein
VTANVIFEPMPTSEKTQTYVITEITLRSGTTYVIHLYRLCHTEVHRGNKITFETVKMYT